LSNPKTSTAAGIIEGAGREKEGLVGRQAGRQALVRLDLGEIEGSDRETERQRDRETERQRDRETERQRDRETERQTR
jgi:hypothetical protein